MNLYGIFKKSKKEKKQYINSTNIAKHFNLKARDINKIFLELSWIEKKDKWWIKTKSGEALGAVEKYNPKNKQKYVLWEDNIVNNNLLIKKVEILKNKTKNAAKTKKEKEEKGAMYERYIADYFRDNGHTVWEHGKEKGVKDGGMDLFVKDGRNIYFVQCKNWSKWKIDLNTVQATQTKIANLLKQYPQWKDIFDGYNQKILFVAPSGLEKGAYRYIEENSDELEFRKIEI